MHYTLRVLNAGRERRATDVRGKIPLGLGRECACVRDWLDVRRDVSPGDSGPKFGALF